MLFAAPNPPLCSHKVHPAFGLVWRPAWKWAQAVIEGVVSRSVLRVTFRPQVMVSSYRGW